MHDNLHELIHHLIQRPVASLYQGWRVQRIGGSANNILFRASSEEADLAVKLTIRDGRRRAACIRTYYPFMLVWWVARLGRMLYEVPLGLDERLVARPSNWQADTLMKMERYAALATAALAGQG